MLAEYDNYVLADAGLSSSDMDAGAVCSSSTGHPDPSSSYLYGWHEAQDDAYTLTELGDAGGDAGGGAPPPPPAYFPDQDMQSLGLPCGMPAWGTEPWQQHGPAHAGNPFDDDAGDALAGLTPGPFSPLPPPSYPVFRTPYPTPSPDPCYPQRLDPFPGSLAPLPLPLHMMSSTPTPAPPTPTSRSAKRRRNRKPPQPGAAPPRKRERSERQLHPCKLCDKRFKDNYSVNVHMRTHTGEKPFPCIVCGKMFRQKAHLAKHRSTHQPADVPMWAEGKCKAPNVWTPSIMSPALTS
ncbi:zinc finger protein 467-like [Thrips palmi]|uniref:Zinc finger protein 467-like n=1 Tax=Thrips palmi TaxID=161013 RepID=A0A6P8YCZ8_THRPL|nr:zinc finger protein 467-like [Thrips palmi]